MHPQARAIDALGKQLGWQRRGDSSRATRTVTSLAVTLEANDSTIDGSLDFDLFAIVAVSEIYQRLSTAITDLGVLRQVDLRLARRQVRIVSAFGSKFR